MSANRARKPPSYGSGRSLDSSTLVTGTPRQAHRPASRQMHPFGTCRTVDEFTLKQAHRPFGSLPTPSERVQERIVWRINVHDSCR